MASSGLGVNDDCVTKFLAMKKNHDFKYILMKISEDQKTIEVVDSKLENASCIDDKDEECWNHLVSEELKDDEPYYILYNMHGHDDEGKLIEKIIFVCWCSDLAKTRVKMIFASSKEGLKSKFDGVAKFFQASGRDELMYKDLFKELY